MLSARASLSFSFPVGVKLTLQVFKIWKYRQMSKAGEEGRAGDTIAHTMMTWSDRRERERERERRDHHRHQTLKSANEWLCGHCVLHFFSFYSNLFSIQQHRQRTKSRLSNRWERIASEKATANSKNRWSVQDNARSLAGHKKTRHLYAVTFHSPLL